MAQMQSQAAIISLETSPSSAIFPPDVLSPPTIPSPTIYVTFRVLQLVTAFRRRLKLKTRVRTNEEAASWNKEARQDFEHRSFAQIKRRAGQDSRSRIAAQQVFAKPSNTSTALTTASPDTREAATEKITRLLAQLDRPLYGNESISIVAKSHKLFLDPRRSFAIDRLPLRQLAHILALVQDLLDTVKRAHPLAFGDSHICKGDEVLHPVFDESSAANLVHLLLCLEHRLISLIIARCIEEFLNHVKECQKNRNVHCHEPIFEYPNAKHPLNTTWPWAIRPSLAVLWGVCWMFYDNVNNHSNNINSNNYRFDSRGNMVDVYGNIVVPRQAIDTYGSFIPEFRSQRRQSQSPLFRGRALSNSMSSPRRPSQAPSRAIAIMESPQATQPPFTANLSPRESFDSIVPVPYAASAANHSIEAGDRLADARQHSLSVPGADTYFTSAPPHSSIFPLLPQDAPTFNFSAGLSAWEQQQHHHHQSEETGFTDVYNSSQQLLPPHDTRNLTPSIRLTTDVAGAQNYLAPQAASPSHSASPPGTFNNNTFQYPGHLSPHHQSYMPQETENMQTPVSPISAHNSPHDTTMSEPLQQSRKRSHSMMSQQDPSIQLQSELPIPGRAASVASQGAAAASPGEDYSPRGSRAFKRGDPPQNPHGKYICTFADECADQIFDRKCEWSKHMDKHDRPYRCPHPSCAKLQGFTYSGGLLRHEREVHGKHGGPKAQLMCPHADCKRHSGKGFTRKENLNEHLRRVHNSKEQTAEDPAMVAIQSQNTDIAPGADEAGTPASLGGVHDPALMSTAGDVKYQHNKDSLPALLEQASVDQEVKRLRLECDTKDGRIRELEAGAAVQEGRLRSLENTISQLHAELQAQRASQQLQSEPIENGN